MAHTVGKKHMRNRSGVKFWTTHILTPSLWLGSIASARLSVLVCKGSLKDALPIR